LDAELILMTILDASPPKAVQRWLADDYARNGRFVWELAKPVLGLLAPKRGERILDLSCGDGALSCEIAAAGADVLAADLSDDLLGAAAAKGLKTMRVDGHALPFVEEFDAVFSNAALHWMRRPELVVESVARALKPHGRFVGEFGGHGNVAAIATAMRAVGERHGGDPERVAPWYFPTVKDYRRELEGSGFEVKTIMLVPRPTPLEIGMEGWLQTCGRSFFEQFQEPERSQVLGEVLVLLHPSLCDSQGCWTADHIRLRFAAERIA
jgi:SAM-dependent methyltransferase